MSENNFRPLLASDRIHADAQRRMAALEQGIVEEVERAAAREPVVIVGMAMNPFVRRARRALDAAGVPHCYLAYGGYLSQWRRRNALKMWSGWPTFPMVFVKGGLIGGAQDLDKLIAAGELKRLLG